MDTVNTPSGIETDLQEVLECVSSGKTVDHNLKRRVRERAENIRKQIFAIHGIQNIGVDLIRELRGDLPDA
jgi:hypothetical protein